MLDALNQDYPVVGGGTLRPYAAAVDSGDGETTHYVYAFARNNRTRHIIATKGQSIAGKALLGKPTRQDVNFKKQVIKKGVDLWPVGSDTGKAIVHARLKLDGERGPGVMHWPLGLTDDYWKQLTSERQVTKLVNGFPKRVWVKKDSDYNEDLDCEVLALAALEYVKTRHNRKTMYTQFADAIRVEKEREVEKRPAPPKPAAYRVGGRSNFVNSWG